jgi:hypothetical protein
MKRCTVASLCASEPRILFCVCDAGQLYTGAFGKPRVQLKSPTPALRGGAPEYAE